MTAKHNIDGDTRTVIDFTSSFFFWQPREIQGAYDGCGYTYIVHTQYYYYLYIITTYDFETEK